MYFNPIQLLCLLSTASGLIVRMPVPQPVQRNPQNFWTPAAFLGQTEPLVGTCVCGGGGCPACGGLFEEAIAPAKATCVCGGEGCAACGGMLMASADAVQTLAPRAHH